MMNSRKALGLALFLVGVVFAPNDVRAAITAVDFGASSSWFATTDRALGMLWLQGITNEQVPGDPAFVPYDNPATPVLNPNRMMWACGADGSLCPRVSDPDEPEFRNGPNEAFFRYTFSIKPEAFAQSVAGSIIADDYFELYVNGDFILAGALSNHQTVTDPEDPEEVPDPIPIPLPDFSDFLHEGENTLAIYAADGFLRVDQCLFNEDEIVSKEDGQRFCIGNNGLEYVFVQGAATIVPEPATLTLLGLAVAAALSCSIGGVRRRTG